MTTKLAYAICHISYLLYFLCFLQVLRQKRKTPRVPLLFKEIKELNVNPTFEIRFMQVNIQNNLIAAENYKCTEVNNHYLDDIRQKNFLNGLANARNILSHLEDSLQKSTAYEKKLLRCKATHAHHHDADDWWDDEFLKDDDEETENSKALKKVSSFQADLSESWSTMSIVCLQYQYEELSKRYEALLRAYNGKCSDVTSRDKALAQLKQHAGIMHAKLAHAHRALLSVADKYLLLKKRRNVQLCLYEKKINFLKGRVREVVSAVDRARLQLDNQFSRTMHAEIDSDYALLMAEMRKCNQLFMENLQLKAQLEELMPGSVNWEK